MTFGLFHNEPSLGFFVGCLYKHLPDIYSLQSLLTSVILFSLTFSDGRIWDRGYDNP